MQTKLNLKKMTAIFIAAPIALMFMTCCAACKHTLYNGNTVTDSIMMASLGDSIATEILHSKKVIVERLFPESDTTHVNIIKILNEQESAIVAFLFSNPDNYVSNNVVFGVFNPSISVTFEGNDSTYKAYFDFGLGKWSLSNNNSDEELFKYDLKSKEILRCCNMLFPDDEFHKFLLTNNQ